MSHLDDQEKTIYFQGKSLFLSLEGYFVWHSPFEWIFFNILQRIIIWNINKSYYGGKDRKNNSNHQMDQSYHFVKSTIVCRLVIITFGITGVIFLAVNNLLSGKFFMIFSPLYMAYTCNSLSAFGIVLFATEFKVDAVLKRVGFLRSLLGRAMFNILYKILIISLSSQVFYYFSCGASNTLLGWVFGMALFGLGIFYLFLHFCKGSQYNKAMYDRLNQWMI